MSSLLMGYVPGKLVSKSPVDPVGDYDTINAIIGNMEKHQAVVGSAEDQLAYRRRMLLYLGVAPSEAILHDRGHVIRRDFLSSISVERLSRLPFYAEITSEDWRKEIISMLRTFFQCAECGERDVNEMLSFGRWRCTRLIQITVKPSADGLMRIGHKTLGVPRPCNAWTTRYGEQPQANTIVVRVKADHRWPNMEMVGRKAFANIKMPESVLNLLPPMFKPLAEACSSMKGLRGTTLRMSRTTPVVSSSTSAFYTASPMSGAGPGMYKASRDMGLGGTGTARRQPVAEDDERATDNTYSVVRDTTVVSRHDWNTERDLRRAGMFCHGLDEVVQFIVRGKGHIVKYEAPSRDKNIYCPTFIPIAIATEEELASWKQRDLVAL